MAIFSNHDMVALIPPSFSTGNVLSSPSVNASCSTPTTLTLLQTCQNSQEAKQLHAQLVVSGLLHRPPNAVRLLKFYVTTSEIQYAFSIFNKIPSPDVFAYNTIIRGLTLNKDPYLSLVIYNELLLDGLSPDSHTYTFVFKACSKLQAIFEGKQVHCQIIKAGIEPNTYIHSSLIHMYINSGSIVCAEHVLADFSEENTSAKNSIISGYLNLGHIEKARVMFDNLVTKDEASWSAMITGYTKSGMYARALIIFQEMVTGYQVFPNESALVSALSACAHLGALELGRWMHAYLSKTGANISCSLNTALIYMYAKCGSIKCSYMLFVKMHQRDIVTWGVIISGFAIHGHAEKCFELFDEMVAEGNQPNGAVFVAVLSACSHAGYVELGQKYFYRMVHDYRITPSIEHYGCMVDLLSRAGRLAEAEEVILRMPEEPNSVIWGTLLSACRKYNDLDRGKFAFRRLIELEPKSGDRYKLAGLMFDNAGEEENVIKIRKFIRENDLETTRGISFIEIDGMMNEFVAGNIDHIKSREIYNMWKSLNRTLNISST